MYKYCYSNIGVIFMQSVYACPSILKQTAAVPPTLVAEVRVNRELLKVNISKFKTQNFGDRGKCDFD